MFQAQVNVRKAILGCTASVFALAAAMPASAQDANANDSNPQSATNADQTAGQASPSGTPAEGRTLLGTITTATPDGIATFSLDAVLPAGTGTVFTATATNQGNQNTSEFSVPLRASVFAAAPDNGGQ